MGKRIDAEKRRAIAEAYLLNDGRTYKDIAEQFGISYETARKIINEELNAGNGIKPDRRAKTDTPEWMAHVTPLHKHKQELETIIEHKKAELEQAQQEYRNYLATIRQLMEETV